MLLMGISRILQRRFRKWIEFTKYSQQSPFNPVPSFLHQSGVVGIWHTANFQSRRNPHSGIAILGRCSELVRSSAYAASSKPDWLINLVLSTKHTYPVQLCGVDAHAVYSTSSVPKSDRSYFPATLVPAKVPSRAMNRRKNRGTG